MKQILLIAGLCLACAAPAQSPVDSSFTDGPYIFFDSNQVVAKWVSGGTLFADTLSPGELLHLDSGVSHSFDPSCVDLVDPFVAHPRISFKGVKKLAAISDIHGQYILMLKLLRAHGVIDAEGDWAFGEGHLVVLGDVFDRGDEVVDILWLIHKLEKQAEDANGRVHYLLGNHEVMNLKNDLRYVNKKYRTTTSLTRIPYNVLFGPETYFGRWIRSKPVSVTINDMVFVHGGLSETCLNLGLSLEQMNTAFQKQILDLPEEDILADPALKILYSEVGPIWYRGYFEEGFTKKRARDILRFLGKKHIVIGHTPAPQVRGLHGSKIFAIDSSIQLGEDGELFWYEGGKFFRGSLSGEKIKLQ